MIITWYGLSCLKIETQDTVIAVSPFAKDEAMNLSRAPRFKADLLLVSQQTPMYNGISGIDGNPFSVTNPGEYEVSGIFVYGLPTPSVDGISNTAFVIRSEDLTIAYLGGMRDAKLSEDAMHKLESIDILLIPIGGDGTYMASQAAKLVAQLEPSIVIPVHYKTPGMKGKLDTLDSFAKEMNMKSDTMEKLIIRKRDIPEEGMRFVVLQSQGPTKE